MKIYLAAAYQRQAEMREYRKVLERLPDVAVVSSWLDQEHEDDGQESVPFDVMRKCSQQDLLDIRSCDMFVCFASTPDKPWNRGGRHVELGYALGHHKRCIVIGEGETIFHTLCDQALTFSGFVNWLSALHI